jgi:leucyl-tRNA synthetase
LRQAAIADPVIAPYLEGRTVKKVIVAQGKLVNIVVG